MGRNSLGLAGFLILAASCGGPPEREGPPVLVVGMDGLEWSVMDPLLRQGRLPAFAALIERGVAGSIRTTQPTFSPVLWTTMATGVGPLDHGIHNFFEASLKGQIVNPRNPLPYSSNCRKVPALWNLAGEEGMDSLSVAWWVSWPAEEVPRGRIVASYAAQAQGNLLWKAGVWTEGLPRLTWPPELGAEVLPHLKRGEPAGPLREEYNEAFGIVPGKEGWEFPAGRDAFFRFSFHGDRTHYAVMRDQLSREIADLNMVYFGLADVAGHFFWRYRQPEAYQYPVPPEHVDRLGDRIEKAYEILDGWLGGLLDEVGEDCMVMVVSDHGMHAANLKSPRHPQSGAHEDAPDGVLILAGPGVRKLGILAPRDRRMGSIFAVAPTILDWLGSGPPGYMEGEPLRRWMTDSWKNSNPETRGRDHRRGFRKATPPITPGEDASASFLDSMREIGYVDSED
jgi:hypothetical protein